MLETERQSAAKSKVHFGKVQRLSERFSPLNNPDGSVNWTKEYFYYVHGQTTQYSLGYIQVDIDGSTRTFKIVDDAAESLVLRTTGTWANGNAGSDVSVTMVMTRVGP